MTTLASILLQWGPHEPHGPMGPHWGGGGGTWGAVGGGFGGLQPLVWLLALGVLVLGAYLAVRLAAERTDGRTDALTVLRGRYARGEVDDEEFAERRARLVDDP